MIYVSAESSSLFPRFTICSTLNIFYLHALSTLAIPLPFMVF